MNSMATDDSNSPLCDNVELGIDSKRLVIRLSGKPTIAVEPAPEEIEWTNPLFVPSDDDDGDVSNDHDQCDARSE